MKKVLASFIALATLTGCAGYYDYYKGGVRYTQDGEDCVYYAGEFGRNFSDEIRGMDANKKIVYRNTRCADLYARDNSINAPRHDRQVLTPAPQMTQCSSCNTCKTCASRPQVVRRKYVIVSAM